MPGNVDAWIAGLYTPSDRRAEPSMAVPALAAAARKHGVTVHQGCAARLLETQGGRVSAVVTEQGPFARCPCCLREVRGRRCSAGATASSFRSASSTQPHAAQRPRRNHDGCSRIRRRLDGGFTLALRNRGKVELSPDLFRYARTFWPTYKHRRKGLWKVVLRSVRAR
jgi:hypothetical protein